MIATLTNYELRTFFAPRAPMTLNRKSLTISLPKLMRRQMVEARMGELSRVPVPYFVKAAGLAGLHAWQIDIVRKRYCIHIAVFDTDLLTKARTLDEALDLLDILMDALVSVSAMRSAVIKEVVNAVPGLTHVQHAELTAYGRAAGMY